MWQLTFTTANTQDVMVTPRTKSPLCWYGYSTHIANDVTPTVRSISVQHVEGRALVPLPHTQGQQVKEENFTLWTLFAGLGVIPTNSLTKIKTCLIGEYSLVYWDSRFPFRTLTRCLVTIVSYVNYPWQISTLLLSCKYPFAFTEHLRMMYDESWTNYPWLLNVVNLDLYWIRKYIQSQVVAV